MILGICESEEMQTIIHHIGNVSEDKLRKSLRKKFDWYPPLPPFGQDRLRQLKEYQKSSELSEEEQSELARLISDLIVLIYAKKSLWKEILHLEKKIAQLRHKGKTAEFHELETVYDHKREGYFNHPADRLRLDFIERWNGKHILACLKVLEKITKQEFISVKEVELIPEKITVYDKKTKTRKKINPFA